jgi:rfaE bifunctional protein kinase chain/domain
MPHLRAVLSSEAIAALPHEGFAGTTVLIVGDVMLDKYIEGEVHRISPEAPVPILSVLGERAVAGGAANVALNVTGLRARAVLVGVTGEDASGGRLRQLLSQANVDVTGLVADHRRPTTCKTRVVSGNHQIVRLDEEQTGELASETETELLKHIEELLPDVDAVILSDYDKGVLSGDRPASIIQECRSRGIPIMVDPKRHDYQAFSGATCITPNWKEFQQTLKLLAIPGALGESGPTLRRRLNCTALLVTQGANGMTLVTESGVHHLPALAEEVFDVSGAGDTVIATLSTALGARMPLLTAIELANAAASVVVQRVGTAPVHWSDFYDL